jgi:IS1 transposase
MCLDDGRTPSFWCSNAVKALWHYTLFHRRLGAYERHVEAEKHTIGKTNTQKIESKHINLRTRIKRLVRRTSCFSRTERMHDLVIGLFIKRYEFRRSI